MCVCVAMACESATVSESATAAMLQRASVFVAIACGSATVSESTAKAMLQHAYVFVAMATVCESAAAILMELDIKCSNRRSGGPFLTAAIYTSITHIYCLNRCFLILVYAYIPSFPYI